MKKLFIIFCLAVLAFGCGNYSGSSYEEEILTEEKVSPEMSHIWVEIKELGYLTIKNIDSLKLAQKNKSSDTSKFFLKVEEGKAKIKFLIDEYDSLENLNKK
jgi:hypothetical protein